MKKKILAVALGLTLCFGMTGCQSVTKDFGGSTTIELEPNQKLEEITWKDDSLWYLTRPMTDDDISCILEELKSPIFIGSKEVMNNFKIENEPVQKQKRVELFENEDVVLEQRGNRYYLSLYDKEGKFQREVTIDVKDDYKVGLGNCK